MSITTNLQKHIKTGQKMLISADDYQQMGAAGIFENKPKVELIDGEIYTLSPITSKHNSHVDKASRFFNRHLFDKALVRTQGSIRLDDYSEPEPDIAILRYEDHFYNITQATAADTLLVIEIAVVTLKRDRTVKKKKYATANIPEYWIIIPKKQIIEVFKNPEDGDYSEKTTYKVKNSWTIGGFDLKVKGSDFLIP